MHQGDLLSWTHILCDISHCNLFDILKARPFVMTKAQAIALEMSEASTEESHLKVK